MSVVEKARRRQEWRLRISRWRQNLVAVPASLGRIPKSIIAVGMLVLGSAIGAIGPFLLREHERARAQQDERRKLLEVIVQHSATTEDVVKRYAEALEVRMNYKVQTQLRELSIREDLQVGMITAAEAENELGRVTREAENVETQFAELAKKHDGQLERITEWRIGALQQFKRLFPLQSKPAETAFASAAANLSSYRRLAADRAIANEIVASIHEHRIRSAFLERRGKKISEEEYRNRLRESAKVNVGTRTARLRIDLSVLSELAATAQPEIAVTRGLTSR